MSIISALRWRYATKRMNGTKIPILKLQIILNAISLAPSSFGLQPYTIFVIENEDLLAKIKPIAMDQPQITEASALLVFAVWENLSREKIDAYIVLIARERSVEIESLNEMKMHISGQLENSDQENLTWNSKQAYIALGFGLIAAADESIDSTPIEGFDKNALDKLLKLSDMGLRSTVLLALGYRDSKNDYLVNLKKIRRANDQLFINLT